MAKEGNISNDSDNMLGHFASILVPILLILTVATSEDDFDSYKVHCILSNSDDQALIDPCYAALFSPSSFNAKSTVIYSQDLFCTDTLVKSKYRGIVMINRGGCSFEDKARIAFKLGFEALVVINNNATAFPMGASSNTFQSSIPVVMVGNNTIELYQNRNVIFTFSMAHKRK